MLSYAKWIYIIYNFVAVLMGLRNRGIIGRYAPCGEYCGDITGISCEIWNPWYWECQTNHNVDCHDIMVIFPGMCTAKDIIGYLMVIISNNIVWLILVCLEMRIHPQFVATKNAKNVVLKCYAIGSYCRVPVFWAPNRPRSGSQHPRNKAGKLAERSKMTHLFTAKRLPSPTIGWSNPGWKLVRLPQKKLRHSGIAISTWSIIQLSCQLGWSSENAQIDK